MWKAEPRKPRAHPFREKENSKLLVPWGYSRGAKTVRPVSLQRLQTSFPHSVGIGVTFPPDIRSLLVGGLVPAFRDQLFELQVLPVKG